MYSDFRYGSAFHKLGGSNFVPDQDQEKKVDESKKLFSTKEIKQVETSSHSSEILKAGYRNSNRAAVTLGLVGGVLGGALQGGPGVPFGMSVGSSVGAHLGALGGIVIESSKPSSSQEIADPEERSLEATNNRFFGHVVQLVDEAGHHSALGSISVGVGALLTSLVTGNPLPVALHAAGVYSGATWAFGLITGSAHWILQHRQRLGERLEREQTSSPGDIELRPLTSPSLKEVADDKDVDNTMNVRSDKVKED